MLSGAHRREQRIFDDRFLPTGSNWHSLRLAWLRRLKVDPNDDIAQAAATQAPCAISVSLAVPKTLLLPAKIEILVFPSTAVVLPWLLEPQTERKY